MKVSPRKLIPLGLCAVAAALVSALQVWVEKSGEFDLPRRLEWMTYDWRARLALKVPLPQPPNIGFVFVNDETIERVLRGAFGYKAGLYWPRHVYGRLVHELDAQGAEAIGFDVLFPDLRPDHPSVRLPDGTTNSSDFYFARSLRESGKVILGGVADAPLPELFRTNAWTVGDISARRDPDGILRRTKAFEDYVLWHPAIRDAAAALDGFSCSTNRLSFLSSGGYRIDVPVAADGTFDLTTLLEGARGIKVPGKTRRIEKAFVRQRAWDLGLTAAARYLRLDLAHAVVEPGRQILLRGENNIERVIPIDQDGRFFIDWSLTYGDRRLTFESAHSLLDSERRRELGQAGSILNLWRHKIALIGSVASGNDLTDYGATPLDKETYLTSRYWNTASSLITGRFIQPLGLPASIGVILAMCLFAGMLTWNLRSLFASSAVLLLATVYTALCVWCYIEVRYWLPLVLPCFGLALTHFALITYRVVFEQRERRRIRNVFAKIVSPNVVTELLQAEKLSLGGAQREATIFFSDVRGFTEMTDESHARAEEHVRQHQLEPAEAEAYLDERAQEVLRTVNLYLGTIAETVKRHEGTLDKYIGDCVMAFWGAPTPSRSHALDCVHAAIEAQRAIHALNQQRTEENQRREQENVLRAGQGLPPEPPLKLLSLGTGINTGTVTVGLMGSEQHTFNYTVFGREVNLAARLEGLSGRGRILIGDGTYRALLEMEPALAASCQELAPAQVKGFRTPVRIYEVPWQESPAAPARGMTPAPSESSRLAP